MEEEQKGQEQGRQNNKYDKIFKENIEAILLPFVEKYLNFKIVSSRVLEAKLQSTIEREVDFLRIVKTDKGEEFILHIEFQSSNELEMIYRIKEYNAIIQRKFKEEEEDENKGKHKRRRKPRRKLEMRHYVIYLGKGRMTMPTRLEEKHVFRQFEVLSINELDFDKMLQSQIPEEIILAILSDFKGADPEKMIRLIVGKLKKYSKNDAELKKFVEQLSILSDLRKLEKKTIKTIKNMPITYNIKDSYTYKLGKKEGVELGREEGREQGREEERAQQQKKAIAAMLLLGNNPEQIAKYLEVPIELVEEIQEDLDDD